MSQKIKTRPFIFEIEIKEIKGSIPKDEYDDFVEWLEFQPLECGVGRNYEYYTLENGDDVAVSFYVKPVS